MSSYALDGRTSRRKNNSLHLDFVDGNGAVASATQSGADGRKTKMSVLMGWRNGGPGRHLITYADGSEQIVEVAGPKEPVRILGGDGTELGQITPGDPSEYRSADGTLTLSIEPAEPASAGTVPMLIKQSNGTPIHMVDVRTNSEWKVRDSLKAAADLYMLFTASGAQSLPIRRFGTQVTSDSTPAKAAIDALVAISVAVTIGLVDLVPQP